MIHFLIKNELFGSEFSKIPRDYTIKQLKSKIIEIYKNNNNSFKEVYEKLKKTPSITKLGITLLYRAKKIGAKIGENKTLVDFFKEILKTTEMKESGSFTVDGMIWMKISYETSS